MKLTQSINKLKQDIIVNVTDILCNKLNDG